MKKRLTGLIVGILIVGSVTVSSAATWTIEVVKDGVAQSSRVVEAHEIKDIQVASRRTGKNVYAYFWEAMNDLFSRVEDENIAAQVEAELQDIKTRMRE